MFLPHSCQNARSPLVLKEVLLVHCGEGIGVEGADFLDRESTPFLILPPIETLESYITSYIEFKYLHL